MLGIEDDIEKMKFMKPKKKSKKKSPAVPKDDDFDVLDQILSV